MFHGFASQTGGAVSVHIYVGSCLCVVVSPWNRALCGIRAGADQSPKLTKKRSSSLFRNSLLLIDVFVCCLHLLHLRFFFLPTTKYVFISFEVEQFFGISSNTNESNIRLPSSFFSLPLENLPTTFSPRLC